jgi:hypothetical protein
VTREGKQIEKIDQTDDIIDCSMQLNSFFMVSISNRVINVVFLFRYGLETYLTNIVVLLKSIDIKYIDIKHKIDK